MIRLIRFLACLLLITVYGCTNENYEFNKIRKYYLQNREIHQAMYDSLTAFCKRNHTKVHLGKPQFKEQAFCFQVFFDSGSRFLPIYFDSSFHRSDYDSLTRNIIVPPGLIENFCKSRCIAIAANSNETFCAFKWEEKFQLGTRGDAQYGILFTSDISVSDRSRTHLDSNACLTTGSAY